MVESRVQCQVWATYYLPRVRTPGARSSHLAHYTLWQQFFCETELVLALLILPDTLPLSSYTQMLVQCPLLHSPVQESQGEISEKGKLRRNSSKATPLRDLSGPVHSPPAGNVPSATTDFIWSSSTKTKKWCVTVGIDLSCQ